MILKIILNSLYYSGLQSALKPALGGKGAILMLHRVENTRRKGFAPNSHLSFSPQLLDQIIFKLKMDGYEFVSLDEAHARLANPVDHESAKPFLSITLDDGYRDNVENAAPVFRRHSVPYTIYVAPGLTQGQSTLWWEDLEHVIAKQKKIIIDMPDGRQEHDISTLKKKRYVHCLLLMELMYECDQNAQRETMAKLCSAYGVDSHAHVSKSIMTWGELRILNKDPLCTIGAHSINHFVLSKLGAEDAEREIAESRDQIAGKLGSLPQHFAYPYGTFKAAGKREFDVVRKLGFKTGTTTRHGVLYNDHKNHMTALPRISLNGNYMSTRYTETLLSGIPTRLVNRGKKLNIA